MHNVELVSAVHLLQRSAGREWQATVVAVARSLALLVALTPTLTSCTVPNAASDPAAPTTIAVYVPPIGPHGRGSVMLVPYSPPIPRKHLAIEAQPAKEAPTPGTEEQP